MKKALLWILGLACLCALPLCGLGYVLMKTRATLLDFVDEPIPINAIEPYQRSTLERNMRLKLPPSAKIAFFQHLKSGPDDLIQAKVILPAADLKPLLAQAPFKGIAWHPLDTASSPFTDREGWSTWTPSKVKKGRTTDFPMPQNPAEHMRVLIDEGSAKTREIYLVWFQT